MTADGRLCVPEPHLQLDPGPPTLGEEQRVPSAELGGLARPLRQGHVEAISHRRAHMPDDSPQALGMCGIAERRPAWICPHDQVKTENAGHARRVHDREPRQLRPLEATDLGRRHAHRPTKHGLAEPGTEPGVTGFVPELAKAPVPAPGPSIESPLD